MEKKYIELTKQEQRSIQGGSRIKDGINNVANWLGQKVGQAMEFLSQLDWSGNFLGY